MDILIIKFIWNIMKAYYVKLEYELKKITLNDSNISIDKKIYECVNLMWLCWISV